MAQSFRKKSGFSFKNLLYILIVIGLIAGSIAAYQAAQSNTYKSAKASTCTKVVDPKFKIQATYLVHEKFNGYFTAKLISPDVGLGTAALKKRPVGFTANTPILINCDGSSMVRTGGRFETNDNSMDLTQLMPGDAVEVEGYPDDPAFVARLINNYPNLTDYESKMIHSIGLRIVPSLVRVEPKLRSTKLKGVLARYSNGTPILYIKNVVVSTTGQKLFDTDEYLKSWVTVRRGSNVGCRKGGIVDYTSDNCQKLANNDLVEITGTLDVPNQLFTNPVGQLIFDKWIALVDDLELENATPTPVPTSFNPNNKKPYIGSYNFPQGKVNVEYSAHISGLDQDRSDILSLTAANLPPGLSLGCGPTGRDGMGIYAVIKCDINGIPTQSGNFDVLYTVTDNHGGQNSRTHTINISP